MTDCRGTFLSLVNYTFRRRSDIISREDLTSLTFAQVISKARDFEASIQTDSAITQQHLEILTPTLVFGADVHHIPHAVTAQHPTTLPWLWKTWALPASLPDFLGEGGI